jgi:ParB-like chromosome segregation protein Spo0J
VNEVALGFQPQPIRLPLTQILPSRKTPAEVLMTQKFKQIKRSIEAVGLIEPLSVTATDSISGHHVLLDGHLRLLALRELGHDSAPCLVATDDEAYTYNNRVNRLSSVQEHMMIRRAVDHGASPEQLAAALSVDVSQIVKKMNLLDGICPEAAELLKDRRFSAELARIIRKMKPMRQVECVDLMVAANNLTVAYAHALLAGTAADMLVEGKKSKAPKGITAEQMERMERESASQQRQYRLVEQSYGEDVLNLVLVQGYLEKLLGNAQVARYLRQRQPELLEQFKAIAETMSLEP